MAAKDQVKLRAKDQLHVSSVQADVIRKGDEFVTDSATAKSLVEQGLATKIAAAPKNKAAPAPANKSRG